VYGSADGGRTWSSTLVTPPVYKASPGHICAGNEWVGIDAAGRQYVAFGARQASGGYALFVVSRYGGAARWHKPVALDPAQTANDDKPMLLAGGRRVYVGWTRWTGRDQSDIVVARSDDGGRTWSAPLRIGHGWGVHLAASRGGTLYAAWWDDGGHLQISRSTDRGVRFDPPVALASLFHTVGLGLGYVPAMRSQPVHPDPSLTVDRAGRVYAGYSLPGRSGRYVAVRVLDGALHRLRTRRVAPVGASSRDAFNATVAADPVTGHVWLCYYLSGSRGSRALATYSCSISKDGGTSWSRPRAAASVPSDEARSGGFATAGGIDSQYGPYEGLAVARGIAHPIWTDTRKLKRLREEIYSTRLEG